jgi:L-lactate dehydrogenase (cytochrome)
MPDQDSGSSQGLLHGLEVAKHNSRESCWVVVNGYAYDVTDFLDEHPGGAAIILKYGGKVRTLLHHILKKL